MNRLSLYTIFIASPATKRGLRCSKTWGIIGVCSHPVFLQQGRLTHIYATTNQQGLMRYFVIVLMLLSMTANCLAVNRAEVRKIKAINENGATYFKNKDYSQAVSQFRKALRLQPKNQSLKDNLAQSLIGESITQKNKGNVDKSIKLLNESISLNDTIPDSHIILAACYLEIGDYTSAEGELKIARIYAPGRTSIHTMLGEIYFQRGDMENALACWSKSHEQQPYNENLTRKLEQARIEWNLLKNFRSKSVHPFTIMYQNQDEQLMAQAVKFCQEAYMEIGSFFDEYPLSRVTIIFYTPDQFDKITKAPHSVAGLYDGKIRIKCTDKLNNTESLRKIIFHEYTHVLVKYLTNDECPFWLNEGLAQALSGPVTDIDLTMLANLELENDLFHIKNMNRFGGVTHVIDHDIDSDLAVKIAYTKSLITTNYMVKTYGMEGCMKLLEQIRTRTPVEQAVQDALGISIDQLDAQAMNLIASIKDKLLDQLHRQQDNEGKQAL